MPSPTRRLSPPQLLAISFGALIALGTAGFWMPFSAAPGRELSLPDALFTAASAVCVTGLIVIDTPADLSAFGEIMLLLLIQAGGLGYMVISTVVAAALGARVTLRERLTLQEALSLASLEGLVRFTRTVFLFTLAFELSGALLLALRWTPEFGLARAGYLGLFHAVSAFNNAGFSLFPDNLVRYRGDVLVNLVVTGLIVAGGLGFLVLSDVGRARRFRRLSLHTRFVLLLTVLLVGTATMAIFALERHNPRTLGALGSGQGVLAAYFQAVTARTAGFNTVDIGALNPATQFLLMVLMFIGASPGGTGGGVKTTTFGITVAALWATVRGSTEPTIFRRRLPPQLVARAFFISLIAFLSLNLVAGLLLVAEQRPLLPVLFEATSAFGTVGLSTGQSGSPLSLVGHFSTAGKLLVALMMFVGRVGPLTLAVALAGRTVPPRLRYPEGKVLIG